MSKTGRNDPCPCGSGKKYKKCCMGKDAPPAPLPNIVTAGGEKLVFLEAHYDLSDRAQAITRLNAAEDFDLASSAPVTPGTTEVRFAWLERGASAGLLNYKPSKLPDFLVSKDADRLLGELSLKSSRLVLRTEGQKRFEVGKRLIESILGNLVRHRLDSIQSLEAAMNSAAEMQPHKLGFQESIPEIPDNDERFAPLQPGETLEDAIHSRGFDTLDEINLFTGMLSEEYNNRPQPGMAGLSPNQARLLLDCGWDDENGPLRLNQRLEIEDIEKTPLLSNMRELISVCESEGGAKATAAGNINRKTVARMIPKLNLMNDRLFEYIREDRKVINEGDVWALHLTRILADLAGLLKKRKGRFRPTQKGLKLVTEENMTNLYWSLFFTVFTKFNLGYNSGYDYPEIQDTIIYSFFVLSCLKPGVWQDTDQTLPDILLPGVLDSIGDACKPEFLDITIQGSIDRWVLNPLSWFGLTETKRGELFRIGVYRTTPLFKKFISFHL